jgi:hypothetical protein
VMPVLRHATAPRNLLFDESTLSVIGISWHMSARG